MSGGNQDAPNQKNEEIERIVYGIRHMDDQDKKLDEIVNTL